LRWRGAGAGYRLTANGSTIPAFLLPQRDIWIRFDGFVQNDPLPILGSAGSLFLKRLQERALLERVHFGD
jgi:hypothetical protein